MILHWSCFDLEDDFCFHGTAGTLNNIGQVYARTPCLWSIYISNPCEKSQRQLLVEALASWCPDGGIKPKASTTLHCPTLHKSIRPDPTMVPGRRVWFYQVTWSWCPDGWIKLFIVRHCIKAFVLPLLRFLLQECVVLTGHMNLVPRWSDQAQSKSFTVPNCIKAFVLTLLWSLAHVYVWS